MLKRVRRVVTAAILLSLLTAHACVSESEAAYSRVIDVPGLGKWMYYAQNDPLWGRFAYGVTDDDRLVLMRSASCGPTALAIALAAQLSEDELPALAQSALHPEIGFCFCECSQTARWHNSKEHEVICPRTPQEYAKWLPMVISCYAAGNNAACREYSNILGTSVTLIEEIARAYGLEYRSESDWEVAKEALADGFSAVTTVGRGAFTDNSHFLCVLGEKDGYIYILDPMMREEYKYDRRGILEILEPGLVRAKETDLIRLGLAGFYMIRKPR